MFKKEIIGLMSGTSLEGLDIAHVEFTHQDKKTAFKLKQIETIPYPQDILKELQECHSIDITSLQILDKRIGAFFGSKINDFISKNKINKKEIDAIASHGQTLLHQPENGFTLQVGCGSTIAYLTGINVINDFRTLDIVAGGQGAPLVPIGDFELFESRADSFLNIGGFCNISFKNEGLINAFDICPGNLPLNHYAKILGYTYDQDGNMAAKGKLNSKILYDLNSLAYYKKSHPKSLGTEWLNKNFYTKLITEETSENILHTISVHVAQQIVDCLNQFQLNSVFVTGGGVKNKFLIDLIIGSYTGEVIIPGDDTIDFKEAIVFAFLGFKSLQNEPNNVSSVTGAERSLCTGVLHKPGY